jgi:PhnB protein
VVGITTYGDIPANPDYLITDEMKNRVMHAHLKVGDADLMFSDTFEGMPYQQGNSIQIAIHPKDEARANKFLGWTWGQIICPSF